MYYLYLLAIGIIGCVLGYVDVHPNMWEWWVIIACECTIWITGNERGEKFGGRK